MPRITDVRLRRGTAALWTSTNPVLGDGEPGLETDTGKLKLGNGTAAWNSLGYHMADKADTAWILSRGTDLVSNGTGLLGNNTNFSAFTYSTEPPAGAAGAFDFSSTVPVSTVAFTDEDLPVDTSRRYLCRFMARQRNANVTASRFYAGISPRDKQAQIILPYHYWYIPNTSTTLTAALNPGDTVANVTSTANWPTGADAESNRYMGIWNWTDPGGRLWPQNTYTRNTPIYTAITATTLTLKSTYAGPSMPAGTPVANTRASSNYMYLATALNAVMPLTWTTFSGSFSGLHDGSTGVATTKFPPGTAFVRLVWLPNYLSSTIPGGETSTQSFAAISFSDATQALLELDTKAPLASPAFTGTPTGITKTHVGLGSVDNTSDVNKPISTATQTALNAKAPLASPAFTGTPTGITKSHVGLGSVDNTADTAKPVSTAQQTALNAKENTIAAGTTSQYWRGDKTWQAHDKGSVGLGNVDNTADTAKPVSTAQQAALDLKAPLASPAFTGTPTGITKTHVGLGNVDNTSDLSKPISTAQQAALDAKANIPLHPDLGAEVTFDVNDISAPLGERLVIPTHVSPPGGQTTHTSALFFPDGWNGWRYWLAHTPYPGGNDDHEDPNLVVSNDGISWQMPPGVTNPLDDADGTPEYNSDVDLKMGPDNTMYLFWRLYDSSATGVEEKLWCRTSTDGVNWTTKASVWVNNQTVRRPVSPTFAYEDGAWTMWYVDVLPSPNVVKRTRSLGQSITSGWETPTVVNGITSQSGKEPWHIFMLRLGGKYYGLLNDCTLDQSGANGDLLFMQSYDGKTFEVSDATVIPRSNPGEHDFLYRSTMVPAFEDGQFGFRVWYVGWVSTPSIVWNVYRTFLKPTVAAGGSGTETEYAVLSPSGFTNKGRIMVEDVGNFMKYTLDIQVYKNATGTIALSTTFASMGLIIPTSLRATTATNNVRYWPVWLSGATNIPANLFINFWSGECLIRLNTGTFTMVNNTFADLTATVYINKADLP